MPTNSIDSDQLEVKATSAILSAAAFWIGSECQAVNDMFMACKRKSNDPAECAEAGIAVSHCVNTLYPRILVIEPILITLSNIIL